LKPTKLSDRLIPPGSLRQRAFDVFGREGFVRLLVQSSRFLLRKGWHFLQRARWRLGDPDRAAVAPSGARLTPAKKIDILCLPVINWEARLQRPQQLLAQFARAGHRVLYLRASFTGFGSPAVAASRISDRIYQLALPGDSTLALYRDELRDPTLAWSTRALRGFFHMNRVTRAICLVHHPFWLPLAIWLNAQYGWKIVYDCMDDVTGFAVAHPSMAARERQLAAQSHLVLASSLVLLERMRPLNDNCILLPNAGDFDFFSRLPPRSVGPLADLPRPVVGYYGAIGEWFDVPALQRAALAHPEWSFVLIGDTWGAHLDQLTSSPNVHFLGEKPYSTLPEYLSGFDVCTIPFLSNPLTQAAHPIKLFEYFSAGKPVVAASLPELRAYADMIELYSTPDEFTACLQRAVSSDSQARAHARRAIARDNTWERRYRTLEASLRPLS
jgi:glycosyltransferase involved in cell wall biosynthesis